VFTELIITLYFTFQIQILSVSKLIDTR